MSTFKITPEDVGRKVIMRNGKQGVIVEYDDDTEQPVTAKFDTTHYYFTPFGQYYATHKSDRDLIAWADELATDQPRPKDLRDEFAMSVVASIVGNQDYYEMPNPEKSKWVDRVALHAYEFADAMLKAREAKP